VSLDQLVEVGEPHTDSIRGIYQKACAELKNGRYETEPDEPTSLPSPDGQHGIPSPDPYHVMREESDGSTREKPMKNQERAGEGFQERAHQEGFLVIALETAI